jgi:hypothetical protein
LATAIKQAHAEGMLQLGDRPRDGGLGRIEAPRCLAHAAGLRDSHQHVEIMQLDSAPDTIADLHATLISEWICFDRIIAL